MRPALEVTSTRARSISLRTSVLTCRPRSPRRSPIPRLSSRWSMSEPLVPVAGSGARGLEATRPAEVGGRARLIVRAEAGPIARLGVLATLTATGGLDEPGRGHAKQEGATEEDERLAPRHVFDVADHLARIGLAEILRDLLGLVGGGQRRVGDLRLIGLHVRRDAPHRAGDLIDALRRHLTATVRLLKADAGGTRGKMAGAFRYMLPRFCQRVLRLGAGGRLVQGRGWLVSSH